LGLNSEGRTDTQPLLREWKLTPAIYTPLTYNVQFWVQNGTFTIGGGLITKTPIIIIGLPRAQDVRLVRQLQCVTALCAQDVTLVSNADPATICQGKFKYQRFNKNRRPARQRPKRTPSYLIITCSQHPHPICTNPRPVPVCTVDQQVSYLAQNARYPV
jgi:hypothetical protein